MLSIRMLYDEHKGRFKKKDIKSGLAVHFAKPPTPSKKSGLRVFFFTMKKTYVEKKCLRRAKIIFSKAGKDPNSH